MHYVILTRFSYTEPLLRHTWLVRFETDCEPDDLARVYREWMKDKIAKEDDGNERYYGSKEVIAAYEAVSLPIAGLNAQIKIAYADVVAAEEAAEKAEQAKAQAEIDRLAAKVLTRSLQAYRAFDGDSREWVMVDASDLVEAVEKLGSSVKRSERTPLTAENVQVLENGCWVWGAKVYANK